jgi:hypothetical protein
MRWASRFFRQAVRNLRPVDRRRRPLRFDSLEPREVPHIHGLVFVDLNQDGVQDPDDLGAGGVTVRATDATGAVETVTTGEDGAYELLSDAENLRIEFSGFPEGTRPGRVVGTSGPVVRFLTASSDRDDVNLGLATPQLVTTQFYYDHALTGLNADSAAVLAFPYGVTDTATPTALANVSHVGSVWGLAFHPSGKLYASAFMKRHAGFGPNAAGTGVTTGGIYVIDPTAAEPGATMLVDLAAAGHNTGENPHPLNAEFDETDNDWLHDADSIQHIGKLSLGGLQVSPDGSTLYTVNLNTRELVRIPLNPDGTRNTSQAITATAIPLGNPTGSGIAAANFAAANVRPFAIAVKDNAVFVGVTYTAQTVGTAADLRAFVYAFDPAQGAFRSYNQTTGAFAPSGTPGPVLIANLNYPRGLADDPTTDVGDEVPATWRRWTDTFNTSLGNEGFPVNPQPWLTDIVFDGPAMVLGIRDRFGDQGGFQTGAASGEDVFTTIAVGDVLRAAPNGSGGWALESAGAAGGVTTAGAGTNEGPGNGEFYFQDKAEIGATEVAMGGLAQVPGFNTVAVTGNDPLAQFNGGIYTFFNSDTDPTPTTNTAGTTFTKAELFATFDPSTFGSANGLGDLEYLPAVGTVQAGDRVFDDANKNGVQDAGEPGIAGVTVEVFQADTRVASDTTDADGSFLFTDLTPNLAYSIRIDTAQAALAHRSLTKADQGTDDALDSDATLAGTTATIAFTAGPEGTSGQAADFGFVAAAEGGPLTLGDTVFRDTNNNGKMDDGEPGIAGVTVELTDAAGTNVLETATTDTNGVYKFVGLEPGIYRVQLAAANFTGTGKLVGATPSATHEDDANTDTDDDNNGMVSGSLGSGGVIQSGPITLEEGKEPATDGDTDPSTNLSLDFGVVTPTATGNLTLGNLVWNDTDNDGTFDAGETGIDGVTVELLDANDVVLQTKTTAGGGLYSFTELAAADYRVRLAASNFSGTGALINFTSSKIASADPDENKNTDNDGTVSGALGSGGVIQTGLVTLAVGDEPGDDGDTDTNTNLSVDFGLATKATSGNLTLGNLVWNDADNDGKLNGTEAGINGVLVELLDAAGAVLQTKTTAGGGLYTFTGLAAGDYRVRLAASNFSGTGALVNFTASSVTAEDPDNDENTNNDGTVSGVLGGAGVIESKNITLTADAEPINDGDNDPNTNLTLDFGVRAIPPAGSLTLGDLVWNDTDNDGAFDTGETGIDGVIVELLNPTGTVVQTKTTAGGGKYTFTGLAAGDYRVRLSASNFIDAGKLVGFSASSKTADDPDSDKNSDNDGAVSGALGSGGVIESKFITLTATGEPTNDGDTLNTTNLSLDFGVTAVGKLTVGDTVWHDKNNNGLLDNGETGIKGVTVQLVNPIGTIIKTTTTDDSGQYKFTDVIPGDYRVRLAANNFKAGGVLVGFTSSTGTNGSASGNFEGLKVPDPDNDTDNDDNGSAFGTLGQDNGGIETGLVTLTATEPGDTNLTLDLGVFQKFSVGNLVFHDKNNNGTRDNGEPGIPGVTVRLLDSAQAQVATTTTDAQGRFLFTHLGEGSYVVQVPSDNFVAGKPLSAFKSSTGAGNAFEPAPATAKDNQDHGTQPTADGPVQSGAITLGPGMPTGESPNTDPNTPDNQSNLTVDFGMFQPIPATAVISGRVILDFNNNATANGPDTGMAGVAVALSGGGLAAPITVQTDAQGNFTFTNLKAGTYTLTETQPATPANQNGKSKVGSGGGNTATENVISNIVVVDGQKANGYIFAEVPIVSIAGTVFEDTNGNGTKETSEPGISGATVTLTGTSVVTGAITSKTATTDASGNYKFEGLTPGTYTVTETQPTGYVDGKDQNGIPAGKVANDKFTAIDLTSTAIPATGFNFGEVKAASLAGSVYDDADNDGAKGASETGIPNVEVRLTGTNDLGQKVNVTTTTNASGAFTFGDLRPGTYTLIESQPTGFTDGKDKAGNSAGTVTNDRIAGITLTSGEVATDYLFGETASTAAGVDLVLTRSPATTSITAPGNVTITYTIRNAGTAAAAGVEVLADYKGLTFVSADSTDFDGTAKKWTIGDLAAGATETIQVTLSAAAAGTFQPTAVASTTSTETVLNNNTVTTTVKAGSVTPTPGVDLVLTRSPASKSITAPGNVTITYTIRNAGDAAAAGVEVLADYKGLTFVSANSTDFDGTAKKWTIGDLAAGATETIQVTLAAAAAGTFQPTAVASTTSTESKINNNTATTTVKAGNVTPPPEPGPTRPMWFLSSGTNARRTPRR